MDATILTLASLRRFARTVSADLPASDEALPALRALLDAARVPYKIVGGLAVIHHGYPRFTKDIDVLVGRAALDGLDAHLKTFGFERARPHRLIHSATQVHVDLLVEGDLIPRAMVAAFPAPDSIAASAADSGYVGLTPLIELKLHSARAQDRADVTALLKCVDDNAYLALEAAMPPRLRSMVATIREEALEELRFSDD